MPAGCVFIDSGGVFTPQNSYDQVEIEECKLRAVRSCSNHEVNILITVMIRTLFVHGFRLLVIGHLFPFWVLSLLKIVEVIYSVL